MYTKGNVTSIAKVVMAMLIQNPSFKFFEMVTFLDEILLKKGMSFTC